MKIVGFVYYGSGKSDMYLKPDSALLVNKKPFFLPDFIVNEQKSPIAAYPTLTVRISRMGRNIEERFADRYYDATALSLHLQADVEDAGRTFEDMIRLKSFDNSFVAGDFSAEKTQTFKLTINESEALDLNNLWMTPERAIAEVSQSITLRTGDMVGVSYQLARVDESGYDSRFLLEREMLLEGTDENGKEVFRCRIK